MARNWREVSCELHPDKNGVWWDLLLYVPTVGVLLLWGLKLWYGAGDQVTVGYALMFLGFFFLMVGGGRVMRRLLIHPQAPVALDIEPDAVRLRLQNGTTTALLKELRFYPDHAGKSFGLTGLNHEGKKCQFVFHRQQFDDDDYQAVEKALSRYK